MNDLRMYVEHLFEGRVLDADTIELKEEIYGNLMARYEDFLNEGIDEKEAFERTCASVTDIDEFMEGTPTDEDDTALPQDEPQTDDDDVDGKKKLQKRVLIAVGIVVIAAVLAIVGGGMFGAMVNSEESTSESVEAATDSEKANATEAQLVKELQRKIEGRIASTSVDTLATYSGAASDDEKVIDLAEKLALGEYCRSVSGSNGKTILEVDYADIPSYIDDIESSSQNNELNRAMVFNAATFFCVMPDVQHISISYNIPGMGDELQLLEFDRSIMESRLDKEHVAFNEECYADQATWDTFASQVAKKSYVKQMINAATR